MTDPNRLDEQRTREAIEAVKKNPDLSTMEKARLVAQLEEKLKGKGD